MSALCQTCDGDRVRHSKHYKYLYYIKKDIVRSRVSTRRPEFARRLAVIAIVHAHKRCLLSTHG